jgi:hypothetical protein
MSLIDFSCRLPFVEEEEEKVIYFVSRKVCKILELAG